jgi:hypothetical protein
VGGGSGSGRERENRGAVLIVSNMGNVGQVLVQVKRQRKWALRGDGEEGGGRRQCRVAAADTVLACIERFVTFVTRRT